MRSSRHPLVDASGLRWISLMWLGHVPWAGWRRALPDAPFVRGLTQDQPAVRWTNRAAGEGIAQDSSSWAGERAAPRVTGTVDGAMDFTV